MYTVEENHDREAFLVKSKGQQEDNPVNDYTKLSDYDDDDSVRTIKKNKRRVQLQRFSDSDGEIESNDFTSVSATQVSNLGSDSDENINFLKLNQTKSRIKNISGESGSDSDRKHSSYTTDVYSRINVIESSKSLNQQSRIKNKRKKMTDKFKKLLNSREKDIVDKKESENEPENEVAVNESESSNDEEISPINNIKQKIKERTSSIKMTICDPDTSDEESQGHQAKPVPRLKKQRHTIPISPKPQRMSAKQAMENMQKIKSESNRMLREKEISLPYHRPKALSLKDIMSRRKPAITSDGKALPIKMNGEQLKQYAQQLEQRQKEMMELCKSDTDDEEVNETLDSFNISDTNKVNNEAVTYKDTLVETHTDSHKEIVLSDESCLPVTSPKSVPHNREPNIEEIIKSYIEPEHNIYHNTSGDQNASGEMELIYNNSVEENDHDKQHIERTPPLEILNIDKKNATQDHNKCELKENTNAEQFDIEKGSQLISLQYDESAKIDSEDMVKCPVKEMPDKDSNGEPHNDLNNEEVDQFLDYEDDICALDTENIIQATDISKDDSNRNLNTHIKRTEMFGVKPKLTGAPGMVINLDTSDLVPTKKLSGVELLKERYTFYAKLKTPDELERSREKRQKPGTQHIKLKQELEDKIAEQRSLEWAKRLEHEKQEKYIEAVLGNDSGDDDDIDKIEAKLGDDNVESSTESEEELLEDDIVIEDKPRKKNPLLADEAEESDGDTDEKDNKINDVEDVVESEDNEEDSSEDEDSSDSEVETYTKNKKGRILKAFEDSDDEDSAKLHKTELMPATKSGNEEDSNKVTMIINLDKNIDDNKGNPDKDISIESVLSQDTNSINILQTPSETTDSQDDILQLAQVPKNSDDIFPSQESINTCKNAKPEKPNTNHCSQDTDLGSQTFSILNSIGPSVYPSYKSGIDLNLDEKEKLIVLSETQSIDGNLDAVVGMCSGSFSQNYIDIKPPSTQSQLSQSQVIGEDVLGMCTGNFYDNQFVSQNDLNESNVSEDMAQDYTLNDPNGDEIEGEKEFPKLSEDTKIQEMTPEDCILNNPKQDEISKKHELPDRLLKSSDKTKLHENDVLKSVLDELNEPDFESPKPMKFFFDGKSQNKENDGTSSNVQLKKKFVIESDDEINDNLESSGHKKKKKLKKKRIQKPALQISDDDDDDSAADGEDFLSKNEYVHNDHEEEKLVEYDSEENEVEIKPLNTKKKRKGTDFFEQEAELTSEDEWLGSGDEDEAGLDRMEREAGDDDTFNQGQLQRELGQIHMRDVLDQDKREVRLIQELLFEDGDLGGGGRQRKFRWRNADGEEEMGTIPELGDSQEEEFESEEQWRKQRHEREMFLKQMKESEATKEDSNITLNRTTIIKANLNSRTMSSLMEDFKNKTTQPTEGPMPEKPVPKEPSPKKTFSILKQNYHGSLLTRGRGALARLAALATPLALDDDAPKIGHLAPSSKRNFVFAAITPQDKEAKVPKRKAKTAVGTPQLVKKMKTEDSKKQNKSSLLDHFSV